MIPMLISVSINLSNKSGTTTMKQKFTFEDEFNYRALWSPSIKSHASDMFALKDAGSRAFADEHKQLLSVEAYTFTKCYDYTFLVTV